MNKNKLGIIGLLLITSVLRLGAAQADPSITGQIAVIGAPYVIDINSTTNLVYVGHKQNTLGVTVIDGASDTMVTNISVGAGQVIGVATNEINNLIYVSNSDGNLYIIDGNSNSVVGTTFLGQSPNQVDFNEATGLVYVARSGNDTVSVVDGITYSVVTHINVGDWPWGIAANATTNQVYVTNSSDATVSVIDGNTNMVTTTIPVSGGSGFISINENTNKIYISTTVPRAITIIDGDTNTVTSTLSRTSQPQDTAVDPVSGRVYVTNYLGGTVSILDGDSNAELTSLPVGTFVIGVDLNPVSHKAYLANFGLGTVTVITDTLDPVQLLLELNDTVMNLNLQRGIDNSLDTKLNRALDALSDAITNNDVSAVNALNAFINETLAQRGNKITETDADFLIQEAEAILNLLL